MFQVSVCTFYVFTARPSGCFKYGQDPTLGPGKLPQGKVFSGKFRKIKTHRAIVPLIRREKLNRHKSI
jgi:hypothetical protein